MRTHNDEAEENVLGAALMSGPAIVAALDEGLKSEHFYRPSRGLIWMAVEYLHNKGDQADPITVAAILEQRGKLDDAGGRPGINSLAQTVSTVTNAGQYAAIVIESATNRKLHQAGRRILEIADGAGEAIEKLSMAEAVLEETTAQSASKDIEPIGFGLAETVSQVVEAYTSGKERSGLRTGFTRLDQMTHGFFPGQLIVLAARPGQGKSTLAQNVTEYVAGKGTGVCIFSLEMAQEEIGLRMIASLGRVSLSNLQTGKMTGEEHGSLLATHEKLMKLPIYVADTEEVTMAGLRAQVRRLKRQKDIGLLVVDYLQLMLSGKNTENRNVEVSQISRGLKMLARELEIPVLAVAQLSREVERRADKRPLLSDLRDSGSIEQDADCVLFIYRDEYYNENSEAKGEAELIVAKQRSGETGKVKLAFVGNHCHFRNFAHDQEVAAADVSESDIPF